MARLIVKEGPGRGTAYELVESPVTIGRDPTNVIQIPSETVSRSHAIIKSFPGPEGEVWRVEDLHSKNGVLVNGRRVSEAELNSGDELRLGEVVLTFILRDFDTFASEGTEAGTRLELRDVLKKETFVQRPAAARVTTEVGRDPKQALLALLELSNLAASARTFPELFAGITGALEKNLRPHRAVPILFDERKGLLRPWVSQKGEFDKVLSRIPISTTVVRYVREHRDAILSEVTGEDERLRDARSITAHEITSAMCAPVLLGDRLLGALYVDRLGDAERFTKADLELLTAFALQAAAGIENVRMREQMGRERYVREKAARGEYDIVGGCEAMQRVFRFIAKAAPSEASVLIEGESGTGKELVARAIHLNSRRRHQPFEAVNCAAIAPTLIESELFGHVRGAFTGADRDRPGRFELADGGTLFLDEIAELPEASQSKLLRALEAGEIRRVGGVKDIKVNVRVIAATNRRLGEERAAGRFREDLYFRLNVLKISLPPLRERPGDVRILAEHFLRHFAEKCGRPQLRFDQRVIQIFEAYSWPGNVRELRNVIERMVVMTDGPVLTVEDVPYEIRSGGSAGDDELMPDVAATGEPPPLREVEKRYIGRILRHTGGNKKEAARILGIDRSTLYAKLKAYGIS